MIKKTFIIQKIKIRTYNNKLNKIIKIIIKIKILVIIIIDKKIKINQQMTKIK